MARKSAEPEPAERSKAPLQPKSTSDERALGRRLAPAQPLALTLLMVPLGTHPLLERL
jgi:hypothetical protein